jgi:hypothetical protein
MKDCDCEGTMSKIQALVVASKVQASSLALRTIAPWPPDQPTIPTTAIRKLLLRLKLGFR